MNPVLHERSHPAYAASISRTEILQVTAQAETPNKFSAEFVWGLIVISTDL